MNNAALNICVQVLHGPMFSFLLDIYLGVELLGYKVIVNCSTVCEPVRPFSKASAPSYLISSILRF